jgi:hypothetical protein
VEGTVVVSLNCARDAPHEEVLTVELFIEAQYNYGAQKCLVMACSIFVETINEQRYTALISRLGCDVLLTMASCEREDSVTQYRAQFDLLRNTQSELTGCISTVEPATKVLSIVVNEHSFIMRKGDRRF